MMWKHISTLPATGQVLVTSDTLDDYNNGSKEKYYSEIELVNLPMLSDGRILCQNSGNYIKANYLKYWTEVPEAVFERDKS